jgi:hypothetical protein
MDETVNKNSSEFCCCMSANWKRFCELSLIHHFSGWRAGVISDHPNVLGPDRNMLEIYTCYNNAIKISCKIDIHMQTIA